MSATATPPRQPHVPGAVIILSISALLMTVPGAVLARPQGLFPAAVVMAALIIAWRAPRPVPVPVRLDPRGAQWISVTSALEGVAAVGGLLACLVAGQLSWWFPLVLGSVAIHLTAFLIWIRRRVDLVLVPVSWVGVGVSVVLTAQGQWRAGWIEGGWVMAIAVLGYVLALATPAGNALCGPVRVERVRTAG